MQWQYRFESHPYPLLIICSLSRFFQRYLVHLRLTWRNLWRHSMWSRLLATACNGALSCVGSQKRTEMPTNISGCRWVGRLMSVEWQCRLSKNHFIKSYLQDFHQHKTNVLLHSLKVRLYDNCKGSVSFCFRNAVVVVILCMDWKILLQINLFRAICRVCKLSRKASIRCKDIWTHARQCFEKFIWRVAINCHRFNGGKC